MATNIVIGVGGTGAKVVEALLHTTTAGLGPESLLVGFVDQDQGNGNVGRARRLLSTLSEMRTLWLGLASPHRIDGAASDLLYTDVQPILAGAETWIPHQGQQQTLTRILGDLGEDAALYDVLFARGEAEQKMKLDEGYRGRPHIGSAAITARVDRDVEFWKRLTELIAQAKNGVDVRLLLAGSVFGGTGAAGFPTLVRLIRKRLAEENVSRNVSIAGVLMLPYFSFTGPEAGGGAAANVARAEELLVQSRGALRYYDNLFGQERVFNELYLVGWNRPFDLGYHSPGAGGQLNPALAPELIAALGACRFFDPDRSIEDDGDNSVFVCARQNEAALGWTDLPATGANGDKIYQKIGKMLRFSMAWKHWGPLVGDPKNFRSLFMHRHTFAKMQSIPNKDFYTNHPPARELEKLSEYVDSFLLWAGSLQAYSRLNNTEFKLWRVNDVMAGPPKFDTPTELLTICPTLDENGWATAFNNAVVTKPGADEPPNARYLTTRLSEAAFPGEHYSGLGRMVAAVHGYSAVTLPPTN